MPELEPKFEKKLVTTVRGTEARSISKWEKEGWEFVSQTPARLLRTTLIFRRPKKSLPKWAWLAAAAAVVVLGIGGTIAGLEGGTSRADKAAPLPSMRTSSIAHEPPTATAAPTADPVSTPVTDAEVVATFRTYFAQRAAANVLFGEAASNVTFTNGVVRVTFDPAAANVDDETFDGVSAHFNFPDFVASPIAFDNEVGNRIRPSVQSIETFKPDGSSLGTLDHAEILALNDLPR